MFPCLSVGAGWEGRRGAAAPTASATEGGGTRRRRTLQVTHDITGGLQLFPFSPLCSYAEAARRAGAMPAPRPHQTEERGTVYETRRRADGSDPPDVRFKYFCSSVEPGVGLNPGSCSKINGLRADCTSLLGCFPSQFNHRFNLCVHVTAGAGSR